MKLKHLLCAALLSVCAINLAHAQSASIQAVLGNFDIANDTGQDAHGFEVEYQGVQASDILYTFDAQRYSAPTIIPTANGVIVRWTSSYDYVAQHFNQTTVAHPAGGNYIGTCYSWLSNYDKSGCEHFGIGVSWTVYTNPNASAVHRWLLADPQNPGMLMGNIKPAPVPEPAYQVVEPAVAGNPPQLAAEFQAPEPAEAPELYGDAQWVKTFKTQLDRAVALDELITGNVVVPQNAAQVETAWDLVQASPPSGGNQRRRRNQGNLDPNTRAVIRRYESYAYTGAYDPVTHKAVCSDPACAAPGVGELGDLLNAQMAAANVIVNAVIVAKNGNGTVSSTDKVISCGSKCAAAYNLNSAVTLTANPGNQAFVGWTGACTGTNLNCVVTVNGQTNVTATFVPYFSFTAKTSGGKGTVACGTGACATKYAQGTNVTLTATPEAGFHFVNWTGSCTGTSTTCNLTVNSNVTAQANFVKN